MPKPARAESLKHPVPTKLSDADLEALRRVARRKRKRRSAVIRQFILDGIKKCDTHPSAA